MFNRLKYIYIFFSFLQKKNLIRKILLLLQIIFIVIFYLSVFPCANNIFCFSFYIFFLHIYTFFFFLIVGN